MSGERTEYSLRLTINGRSLSRVIIDQHYLEKHPDMSDELILDLVSTLNFRYFEIEQRSNGFEYFAYEPVVFKDKHYRLVLMLCLGEDYLGVVNAFRVRRRKK